MKPSIITDQINQDLETALQIIKEKGYRYVELHNVFGKTIEKCTQEEVFKIKALLEEYDMKVTNISSTVFFLCPLYKDDKVTLFNPEFYTIEGNVQEHLKYLENACIIAEELDCPRIRIFPFRWPDNRKGPFGTSEDKKNIEMNLKKAVEIAEKHNITLVLENCPYSHLPKGKMTLQIVQAINNDHLKLLWDPANSYRAIKQNVPEEYLNISLEEELKLIYPYIDHMHIKDYHYNEGNTKLFLHKAIYEGDIDFNTIIEYLSQQKYQGALSLEPEVDYENALVCMERLKSKLDN